MLKASRQTAGAGGKKLKGSRVLNDRLPLIVPTASCRLPLPPIFYCLLLLPSAPVSSVCLRRERGRDGLFEVCGGDFVVADEVLYDAALPVNDEGVRDA